MSLNEVCYARIKDSFWYGLFGDFKLVIDQNTRYFNATKLCTSGGKQFKNWIQNRNSKDLVEYYRNVTHPDSDNLKPPTIYVAPSGTNPTDLLLSGTYVREELLLNLACWLSLDFYHKCYIVIRDFYIQDFRKIKNSKDGLENRVQEVEKSLALIRLKLKPCASPYTENTSLHNCFVIIKKNSLTEEYPYYVIRTQKRNLKQAMKATAKKYPDYDIVFKKEQDPNSVKLFRLMVQELPIVSCNNNFNTSLNQETLTEKINDLYDILLNV